MLRKISLLLLVALLISLAAAGAVGAQGARSVFGWVIADKVTVQAGGLTVGGDTTVTGSVTASNDLSATDDVLVGDDLNVSGGAVVNGDMAVGGTTINAPGTSITVVDSEPITPTTTVARLQATGTVTPSGIAAGSAGQMLTLFVGNASTVIFEDSDVIMLTGTITLGRYDTLTLLSDGTNWLMVSTADN